MSIRLGKMTQNSQPQSLPTAVSAETSVRWHGHWYDYASSHVVLCFMACYAMVWWFVLCCYVLCCAMSCCDMVCCDMMRWVVLICVVFVVLVCVVLVCVVLVCVVLRCVVLCCVVLWCSVLFYKSHRPEMYEAWAHITMLRSTVPDPGQACFVMLQSSP